MTVASELHDALRCSSSDTYLVQSQFASAGLREEI